jgi:hypothetical protein
MKLKPLVTNKTELQLEDRAVLFSYQTPVAVLVYGVGLFVTETKYSRTTTKHISQWCNDKPTSVTLVSQEKIDQMVNGREL